MTCNCIVCQDARKLLADLKAAYESLKADGYGDSVMLRIAVCRNLEMAARELESKGN